MSDGNNNSALLSVALAKILTPLIFPLDILGLRSNYMSDIVDDRQTTQNPSKKTGVDSSATCEGCGHSTQQHSASGKGQDWDQRARGSTDIAFSRGGGR